VYQGADSRKAGKAQLPWLQHTSNSSVLPAKYPRCHGVLYTRKPSSSRGDIIHVFAQTLQIWIRTQKRKNIPGKSQGIGSKAASCPEQSDELFI
jgi:hypothetical protein